MWFLLDKNQNKLGPFKKEEILSRISIGSSSYQDLIWTEGMSDWKEIIEVESFKESLFAKTVHNSEKLDKHITNLKSTHGMTDSKLFETVINSEVFERSLREVKASGSFVDTQLELSERDFRTENDERETETADLSLESEELSTPQKLLKLLGLEQYSEAFETSGVDRTTLFTLKSSDLVDMGIKDIEHRRSILVGSDEYQKFNGNLTSSELLKLIHRSVFELQRIKGLHLFLCIIFSITTLQTVVWFGGEVVQFGDLSSKGQTLVVVLWGVPALVTLYIINSLWSITSSLWKQGNHHHLDKILKSSKSIIRSYFFICIWLFLLGVLSISDSDGVLKKIVGYNEHYNKAILIKLFLVVFIFSTFLHYVKNSLKLFVFFSPKVEPLN